MADQQVSEGTTLQSFGSSAAGSGPLATIIGPINVTAAHGKAYITDFGSTQVDSAADGQFHLERSNDGFVYNIVEISRITMVAGGTVFKTFDSPIKISVGEAYRVRFEQGTPGRCSCELFGQTEKLAIRD